METGTAPDAGDAPILGNWYVNIFPIDGRKATLYVSESTLLSFFLLHGEKPIDPDRIVGSFLGGLGQLLKFADFTPNEIEEVLKYYVDGDACFVRVTDLSFMGSVNAIMQTYTYNIDDNGGLDQTDLTDLILAVNSQIPQKRLGGDTALEVTRNLLKVAKHPLRLVYSASSKRPD